MDEQRAFWLREGLLLAAFVVLAGIAVFAVALPELSDAPDPETDSDHRGSNAASAPQDAGL